MRLSRDWNPEELVSLPRSRLCSLAELSTFMINRIHSVRIRNTEMHWRLLSLPPHQGQTFPPESSANLGSE